MDRIRIREAVVVEGRYDKIKLETLIDAPIVQTNGFRIYKDRDQLALIRRLAETRGLLILTDSDGAGFQIRNYLNGVLPKGTVKHAYIPDLFGKERRKKRPSAEGKLGVEGVPIKILLQTLQKAGVTVENALSTDSRQICKADLYADGFTGGKDSAERRKKLLKYFALPERLTTNAMLSVLNSFLNFEEYCRAVKELNGNKNNS